MNQRRQQNNRQHSTRLPHASSRMQALDQRYFVIFVEMAQLRAAERALSAQWHLWNQQRMALDQEKPQIFVQGLITAFGGPCLLPSAHNWHVRNQNLQRASYRLQFKGVEIQAQLAAYEHELYLIDF